MISIEKSNLGIEQMLGVRSDVGIVRVRHPSILMAKVKRPCPTAVVAAQILKEYAVYLFCDRLYFLRMLFQGSINKRQEIGEHLGVMTLEDSLEDVGTRACSVCICRFEKDRIEMSIE